MSKFHEIPDPKPAVAGRNNRVVMKRLRQIVANWRPRGARETGVSTIARFAHRVMGADGNAYTADEIMPSGVIQYNTEACVIVSASGTDADRGTALVAAYAAAKLLTPNGAALSSTNRAAVVIPPGQYKLTTSLVLDTDFVDLLALVPEKPSRRLATDNDPTPDGSGTNFSNTYYRPGKTVVYCETDYVSTIEQTANDVRMNGFTVAHFGVGVDFYTILFGGSPVDWGALLIGDGSDNSPSFYTDMYFWTFCATFNWCGGVRAYTNFSGTWINCVSNSASFRCGYGARSGTVNTVFSAKMYDCEAGPFSFIGDYFQVATDSTAVNCRFERCKTIGDNMDGANGASGFAGCNNVGITLDDTCVFVECEAGAQSFGIGNENGGVFIRCRGGINSFGSTTSTISGNFSGYAEDCIGGAHSFGGSQETGYGKLSGTLVRCIVEGNTKSTRLEGATIRDSRITCTTTGIHALTLLDSNSVISNSDIIVLQGGTGVPVYAGSALNAAVYACRMNNASNDADGLHSNVTNLVTTPYNVVSDSVE